MAPRRNRTAVQNDGRKAESGTSPDRHALVLVLGDVGRSPRMQYQALSLSKLPRMQVSLVGLSGEKVITDVEQAENIRVERLTPFAPFGKWRPPGLLFLLYAPIKVFVQILQLVWLLFFVLPPADVILVQNPPSIPSLFVVHALRVIRGGRLVIDWHNLGYTVLALSTGERSPLVKIAKVYESYFGRKSQGNLCVTKAMQVWLRDEWQISAQVLYDRPPPFFRRITAETFHDLLLRLDQGMADVAEKFDGADRESAFERTLFTEKLTKGARPSLRKDRPALIISSTSWTADEDFSILLEALALLDRRISQKDLEKDYPNILVAVTGKGPLRDHYMAQAREMSLKRISILSLWLEPDDYPLLLGAADVGVCLHASSSGLDLPMKVLDMFGAQLPVCAVHFSCLDELVEHKRNGLVFKTAGQLSAQLQDLTKGLPKENTLLESLRSNIKNMERWDAQWSKAAEPLFAVKHGKRN